MVQLRFLNSATALSKTVLAIVSVLAVSTSGIGAASASNIKSRYDNARVLEEVVTALRSKIIPAEIKSALLEDTRPEDKEFAKSVVVNWKSYSDTNAFAEFDELIVLDEDGSESLRMRVLDVPHAFEINGRAWTMPFTGSISKSLREHLEKRNDDAASAHAWSKTFARLASQSINAAFAAPPSALTPAYLFASGVKSRALAGETNDGPRPEPNNQPASTTEALIEKSPRKYLAHNGTFFGWLKSFVTIDVQCRDGSAHGTAKVNGDRLAFESRPDGTMIFTVDDKAKTKLLVKSETFDQRKWAADQQTALASFLTSNPSNQALAKKIFQGFFQNAPLDDHDRIYRETAALLRTTMTRLSRDSDYGQPVRKYAHELSEFYKSRTRRIVTEKIAAAKCTKSDCSAIESENQRSTIQHWLSRDDQQHIENALKWKPKDSSAGAARITRTETTGLPVFSIELGNKKLGPADMQAAEKLIVEAHRAAQRSSNNVRNMTLSLRPLGACCAETECRKSMLESIFNKDLKKSLPVKK